MAVLTKDFYTGNPEPKVYPFASGEDAADLIVTTTAGNSVVVCTGYEV